jgi:hypothetical protein
MVDATVDAYYATKQNTVSTLADRVVWVVFWVKTAVKLSCIKCGLGGCYDDGLGAEAD